MKKESFTFLVVSITVLFVACTSDKIIPEVEEPQKLEVRVQPMFNDETIFEDSVYTTVEGYDLKFTELKFFFSEINHNGTVLADAAYFDWINKGTLVLSVQAKSTDFPTLSGNLGVGEAVNHSDPSAFPNDHPLNISNSGDMHWDWNPGYIFVKVEAKVDTIPDGIPLFDHNVVLHVGLDENLETWVFTDLNWVQVDCCLSRLSLKLDMAKFLQNDGQNIDLKTENSTHSAPGQEVLSTKVIQNFKAALSKL